MAERIVLITGASGGLGQTMTRRWLETGAKVVGIASRADSLDALGSHPNLATAAFDLTQEESAAEMVAFARATFGVPDTLLHLVGTFDMAPFGDEQAPHLWQKLMAVNVDAAFHTFRAVVPALRERGGGSIVAISSRAAQAPGAGVWAYAASKAALNALAKSLAEELKPENIRVNVISTSTIDTPANRLAMGEKHADRWVTPDQLADAALFLTGESSTAISGTVLEVYGLA